VITLKRDTEHHDGKGESPEKNALLQRTAMTCSGTAASVCRSNLYERVFNGSLLLVDIEIESLSRKHPLKQRF
jgi:hypothetical protein